MRRQALLLDGQSGVGIVEEPLSFPQPHQLLVKTHYSAISPGTEMLVYRGQVPSELAVDSLIPSLMGRFSYPLKYGYALVGRVAEVGAEVSRDWLGQMVFAFHPHESAFLTTPDELISIPAGLDALSALFFPNMESAVNFVLDGAPLLGERALVFGQGIVGLLTTILLSRFPLEALVTLDRYPNRRAASLEMGASESLDPAQPDLTTRLDTWFPNGADLSFELSGSPNGLNQAIRRTGFSGRIVIGSWYGKMPVSLDLGGSFHRSRLTLLSSQVSSLNPGTTGRWTRERRRETAWRMVALAAPTRFVTQQIPFEEAAKAYALVDQHPEDAIQVILNYDLA